MSNRRKHNPNIPTYGHPGTGRVSYHAYAVDPKPEDQKRPAHDFDGLEEFDFAAGEVYGIRVWRMDSFGRLRARNTESKPWRPGVNVAECRYGKVLGTAAITGGVNSFAVTLSNYMAYGYGEQRKPHLTPAPQEDCHCGFYAYSDPQHEEAAGDGVEKFVLGIVKGSGRTLIGTKGFRCGKAEIVALRDPTRAGRKQAPWRADQLAKLRCVYPEIPLLPSRADLLAFAPVEAQIPDPSTDEFWELP